MKPACVLQVEDDGNDIFLLEYSFSRAQLPHRLESVRSASEAIHYLSGAGVFGNRVQHPLPSLVLLDLQLPGRSGLDLLRWIRQHPTFENLPVVILTSSSRPQDIQAAYRSGANAYLVKPSSANKILSPEMFVRVLARAQQPCSAGTKPTGRCYKNSSLNRRKFRPRHSCQFTA